MHGVQPQGGLLKAVRAHVVARVAPREGRKAAAHVAREVVLLVRNRMREDPGSLSGPAKVEEFVALATRCALVEYQRTPSRRREGEWALFSEVV